jgi:uncharacterized protein (TIGR03663 family)
VRKRLFHSTLIGRWVVFAILAMLAFAVRLPQLGERPMHTDEAVNACVTGELLAGGGFHYDPRDRHGPVLQLLAKPVARLCGAKAFPELTETELRLTPVIVGAATVLLFGAGVEMFGFISCLVAALMFVVAPLPVYYNRYFIHETLFVAATLGLILSGSRALKGNSVSAGALAGLCAALLAGCKETAAIHFFALGVAAAAGWRLKPRAQWPTLKVAAAALGVFVVAGILLFTWFGRNWGALTDLGRAIPHLAARAGGEGHEKPFGYYFSLLDPTFVFFMLALSGVYAGIRDAAAGVRKTGVPLAVYALVIFLIYSAIPYKTPWLALNLWLPLALLCGLGIQGIWARLKGANSRWIAAIAAGALLTVLGRQTKALAFDKPADEKNPLAYAHTVEDVLRLPPRLEQLAREGNLELPLIAVAAADPWPLPWYLRKFQRVGFWLPGQDPGKADFYITSPEEAKKLGDKLKDRRPEFFGVRPEALVILWPPHGISP